MKKVTAEYGINKPREEPKTVCGCKRCGNLATGRDGLCHKCSTTSNKPGPYYCHLYRSK